MSQASTGVELLDLTSPYMELPTWTNSSSTGSPNMELSVAVSPCPFYGHLWRSLYECPNMELSVFVSHCPFYSQFLSIFCPWVRWFRKICPNMELSVSLISLSLLYISSYMGICDVRVWCQQRDVSSMTHGQSPPSFRVTCDPWSQLIFVFSCK